MEKIALTTEDEAAIAAWKTEHDAELLPRPPAVYDGTNLVVGDHLQIDNSWKVVVLGGQDAAVQSYIPEWGGMIMNIALVDYITDRAGPNGETMPIYDEQQVEARGLAKPAAVDKHAQHAHRRDIKEVLRDAIKRLDHKEAKHAREVLRAAGVLGHDDKD